MIFFPKTITVTLTEPAELITMANFTEPSCHGKSDGTASASATGGTGAYTYLWSTGESPQSIITGLLAGDYVVNSIRMQS